MKTKYFISKISNTDFALFKKYRQGKIILVNNIIWENNDTLPRNVIVFLTSEYFEIDSEGFCIADSTTDAINKYLLDNFNGIAAEYEYTE